MATHVFYSPHSDDETIGMAGSIIRAKSAGHRVVVVLVTDNLPSLRAQSYFATYAGNLTSARLSEWRRAMAILEVDEVRYLGLAEQTIHEDSQYATAVLLGAMDAVDHEFNGAVIHTVMGSADIHAELGHGTKAHRICEEAAQLFASSHPASDVFTHAVYVYSFPLRDRGGSICLELTPSEWATKREALDAYKIGDGRIGYGYASVPELFDAAATDPREFMVKL